MSGTDREILNDLIQFLHGGTDFYRNAAEQTQYAEHQAILMRMVQSRVAAVFYLQPYAENHDSGVQHSHAFGSVLYKLYPEIVAGLDNTVEPKLVQQVEVVERQTLHRMQLSLQQIASPLLKSIILDLHPRLTGGRTTIAPTYEKAC